MKTLKNFALIMVLSSMGAGFAAAEAENPLVGTWRLVKSDNPMPDGSVVPYCTGAHGYIIYTKEGFVSVAINCASDGEGVEPADISDRKFFYTGHYTYDGAHVTHHLENASQTELIGTSFVRNVNISNGVVVLSGENQGQRFAAYWKKI